MVAVIKEIMVADTVMVLQVTLLKAATRIVMLRLLEVVDALVVFTLLVVAALLLKDVDFSLLVRSPSLLNIVWFRDAVVLLLDYEEEISGSTSAASDPSRSDRSARIFPNNSSILEARSSVSSRKNFNSGMLLT